MAGVAGRTAEDMEHTGIRVNVVKSGAVGTDEVHTAMMLIEAGPKFGGKDTLKDLGVVQGGGRSQTEAAMLRWSTACDRLLKIGKLSISMQAKGNFVAAAALSAGAYAATCRAQPDKVLHTMRRWVRHAVWQGGPAADFRLLLWLGLVPCRADPTCAVLLATARMVSLMVQDRQFTLEELRWLWEGKDPANPVAALKAALRRAGVGGDLNVWRKGGEVLRDPLKALTKTRVEWLLEAQRQADTEQVAIGRPKMKLKGLNIHWQWIAGQVRRLRLPQDRQAALLGVMAGDAAPEATAARWNSGNDRCRCGARKDLHHRWWGVPARDGKRVQQSSCWHQPCGR